MRSDSRKADELRPVEIIPGYTRYAEGSAFISIGDTQVLCNVTVEPGVPRWMQSGGKPGGWITGEYAMLPRSTARRTPRETSGLGGRTQEIRRLVGRALRAAVDLNKIGERTCIVDCDVIQADGGTRTAAITGGYVALAIALKKLADAGLVHGDAMLSPVAAASVGVVDGKALLDLNYAEDSVAEVDANVVMNAAGKFIEFQASAEGSPFSRDTLDQFCSLAWKGIAELLAIQQAVLKKV